MAYKIYRTSVLTDIANAIRQQNGLTTLYKPGEMAAAVAALDGTKGDEAGVEAYKEIERGILSSTVFDDIGSAVRAQNGLGTTYAPEDLADAILALTWSTEQKLRAILLDDGTLELNYLTRTSSVTGGTVSKAYAVATEGYEAADDRPWVAVVDEIEHVVIDSSVADSGLTSCAWWFYGCTALQDVTGFEYLAGVTDMSRMFYDCTSLESIYATSFDNSAVTTGERMFTHCYRLVGADGFVPNIYDDQEALAIGGDEGVLTNPDDDPREWIWARLYSDMGVEVSVGDADSSRELTLEQRLCASGSYGSYYAMPWSDVRSSVLSAVIASDMATLATTRCCYWFQGCSKLTSVTGMGNLPKLVEMDHSFGNCKALTTLDLTGLDPTGLVRVPFAFTGCTRLATITVDSAWALPSKCAGTGTFNNCTSIVGGNGTAYDSSNVGYKMMVIDTEDTEGYLTAG